LAVAYGRAYHQVSSEPRVFTDPLAVSILGVEPRTIIDRVEAVQRQHGIDPAMSSSFLAARSRFAEETVAAAVAETAAQVVILGAGLDTFAYRNPHQGLRVFEVDHPDTQAWKRGLLATAGIRIPDGVVFVPADFETARLDDTLAGSGFDRTRATVFVWLGVVMYLTRQAITETVRFIDRMDGAVWLVLDYLYPPADVGQEARAARYAAVGEPWLSFFTATDIAAVLAHADFDQVEDVVAPDLVAEFLGVAAPAATPAPPHLLRARRQASVSRPRLGS
jgi:methyltransferase (TIGR00027 family)